MTKLRSISSSCIKVFQKNLWKRTSLQYVVGISYAFLRFYEINQFQSVRQWQDSIYDRNLSYEKNLVAAFKTSAVFHRMLVKESTSLHTFIHRCTSGIWDVFAQTNPHICVLWNIDSSRPHILPKCPPAQISSDRLSLHHDARSCLLKTTCLFADTLFCPFSYHPYLDNWSTKY